MPFIKSTTNRDLSVMDPSIACTDPILFRTGRRSVVRNRKVTPEKERVEAAPTKGSDIRFVRKTDKFFQNIRFSDIYPSHCNKICL